MSVNELNQGQARTREEYKKAKVEALQKTMEEPKLAKADQTNGESKQEGLKQERVRIRLIPIWLRLVLLVVFVFISMMAGAVVGYGVLGNGKAADVFKESTWTHIIDLVGKK